MSLKDAAPEPGTWTIDTDPRSSRVTASIDAATVKTGNEMRDGKITGPDVLDTEKYPRDEPGA